MAATALKGSVTKYHECKELLPKIERAKERADEVNAAESLPSGYRAAQEAQSVALAAFKAKRFDECKVKRQEAESLFASLRTDVITAVLDVADGHKNAERWDKCKQEAEKVLGWDANNAKALQLKTEAERHLVSSLKIVATIDGEEVRGAKLNDGEKVHVLPVTWKLERGGNYGSYKVVYDRGGKSYEGTFDAMTADWYGLKLQRVALKEEAQDKVQLWKDGPYWAKKNIGAEKPEDYGYYFWWGDTVGYKREGDKWVASDGSASNFKFRNSKNPTSGKSVSDLRSEGWITTDGVLSPQHDAAQKHWGGNWRMPTEMELDDLVNKCYWSWTQVNGVNGYLVRGKGEYSSKSIFLPCAGDGGGTSSLSYAGSNGYYCSSVPHLELDGHFAGGLYFNSGGHHMCGTFRYRGLPVRPVQGFTK